MHFIQMAKAFLYGGRNKALQALALFDRLNIETAGICLTAEDAHEKGANQELVRYCAEKNIVTFPEKSISDPWLHDYIRSQNVEFAYIAQFRRILPEPLINAPQHGTFAIHLSLLPQYRGYAPLNWVLINGEKKTGATLFQAVSEMDAGDIIDQQEITIGDEESVVELDRRLNQIYQKIIEKNIESLVEGTFRARPQDHKQATFACRRLPEDGFIDWKAPARSIHNLVRGLRHPWPGAFCRLGEAGLELASTSVVSDDDTFVGRIPGRVLQRLPDGTVDVLAGRGIVKIKTLIVNGEEIPAAEVIKTTRVRLE
jgi:methionyl-tRNA formyltransferase